jgi:uncharacterized protein (DUF952 family)
MKIRNTIYHLVPEYIYKKSISSLGDYNCKGFEGSNFIHTTISINELKRVGDLLFTKTISKKENPKAGKVYEKPSVEFVLLIIDRSKIKARMKFVKDKFFHIYGSLPKDSYRIKKVRRDREGRFILK